MESKVYFISDTHFSHTNVIEYEKRPFDNIIVMNAYMIDKWNKTVNTNDTVFFLGDFALGEIEKEEAYNDIPRKLNGRIIFIKGNHDRSYSTLNQYFDTRENGFKYDYEDESGVYHFVLSHRPLPASEIPQGYINIHGHIHSHLIDPMLYDPLTHINVSVEVSDYSPICVSDIVKQIKERKYIPSTGEPYPMLKLIKGDDMMRKLATIQKVLDIQPIPDADSIEVATIKGWKVVVRKDEYQIGESVVYFEIDSLIPKTSVTEFLMKKPEDTEARLKTVKLRGQVSQGLIISLGNAYTMNKELNGEDAEPFGESEGTDLSDILHIEKYEPPVKYGNEGESIYWPFSISKTDEERIQNIPEVIDEIINSGEHLCISVKLDGTSTTVIHQPNGVQVAGRNNMFLKTDDVAYNNKYWSTVKKYNLPEILEKYHEEHPGQYVAVQGELVGPGIQGNKMNLPELKLYIFNLFISTDECGSWQKQGYEALIEFCDRNDLDHVPYIYTDFDLRAHNLTNVDALLEFSKGTYRNDAEGYFPDAKEKQQREGLVFRTLDHSKSFKVINNEFLLKGGD